MSCCARERFLPRLQSVGEEDEALLRLVVAEAERQLLLGPLRELAGPLQQEQEGRFVFEQEEVVAVVVVHVGAR